MKYKLATTTWDDKEEDAIRELISARQYSMGDKVAEYEADFAKYFGAKYAVMTSSGSTANLLMIAALFFTSQGNLQLKRGDEVIVPAVSWSTTYFPLQQYGLKVKFVDVDPDTLNFDMLALESAISSKTRVVLAVNLLGNPNDFENISRAIGDRDIILLEDNCESMGASFGSRYTGTFGLMGTFSTYFSHHIATMEGGCILTNDEEIYHILLCIRAHGWTRNLPSRNHVTGFKSDDFFSEAFRFILPGYNVRPLEMSGAIGIEQLKKLTDILTWRRSNALVFCELFSDLEYLRIQKEVGQSSWFGFSLILEEWAPISRSELIKIFEENKVEYRPIVTGNFLKNSEVLKYFDYEVHGEVKNADYLDSNGLFIGNHHVDVADELSFVRSLFPG